MPRAETFFPTDNRSPAALTTGQVQSFNERGYVFPLDVFDDEGVRRNREYFDHLLQRALAAGLGSYDIAGWHTQCPGLYDLVCHARILDYVEDLLGENLICWGSNYFAKMPGDTKRVSWHQDAGYYPLTPAKTITAWLAIDDVDEENGAMRVIPGSHLHGIIPTETSGAQEQNLLKESVRSPASYGLDPVPFQLKAGQMSLHSDFLLHGSEPNPSSRRRCGLTMRFVPPDVRALEPAWANNGVIVRGADPAGHWQDHPRPHHEQIPTGHWLEFE